MQSDTTTTVGDYGRQPPPSTGTTTTSTEPAKPIHGAMPTTGGIDLAPLIVGGALLLAGGLALLARLLGKGSSS